MEYCALIIHLQVYAEMVSAYSVEWNRYELIEALRDPYHYDHKRLRTWVDVHFDPELFCVQQLNSASAVEQACVSLLALSVAASPDAGRVLAVCVGYPVREGSETPAAFPCEHRLTR